MIQYLESEFIKISGYNLFFRVKSVNLKFGLIADFSKHYKLKGITNGKIFRTSDENRSYLMKIFDKHGFIENEDYIFIGENCCKLMDGVPNTSGYNQNLYEELSETKEIDWIYSIKDGNATEYVWYADPLKTIEENDNLLKALGIVIRNIKDLKVDNPYLISTCNDFYHLKINGRKEILKIRKQ